MKKQAQTVSKETFQKTLVVYKLWKEYNKSLREYFTRGANLPEAMSEPIVCYVNNYLWGGAGSEDGLCPITNNKIQVKASSNYKNDLSSFGPRSEFQILEFFRLNQETDNTELYRIPISLLYAIEVNKKQTFRDQQEEGRRPHFSIINKCIIPNNIQPYAIVNMITGEIK